MKWFAVFLIFSLSLYAKPKGHTVVEGKADVHELGKRMEIRTSDRAIIHWKEFSIKKGETLCFAQPSSTSAVLNRVMQDSSCIDGLLQANGRVYLLNPNGILIGPNGNIQAESFIASTLDLENPDFFKNRELLFQGSSQARIVNLGKIAALGGDVFLLAKAVVNEGSLEAKEGTVGIAAGEEILLKPSGMQRLFIAPKSYEERGEGGIENAGVIEATSAELRADGNAFRFAINQSGLIEANAVKSENGSVFLVAEGGTSVNSGIVRASGGSVHILGEQVGVNEGGIVDVSSDLKGGKVLIGGDFQGKNPNIPNAKVSGVMQGGKIFADANIEGDGGKIIVWSDEIAFMEGQLYARGGPDGGDGGFMEVSGVKNLSFTGFACGEAKQGKSGQLLLDPSNITISETGFSSEGISFSLGTYTPFQAIARLAEITPPNALVDTLNSGGVDVTVTTTSSFPNEGNIVLEDGTFTWTSSNNLTLLADNTITLRGTLQNTTGSGGITLNAQNDIVFTGNSIGLKTNTGPITLQAGKDILINPDLPFDIVSNSGSFTFQTGRDFTLGDPNSAGGISIETGGAFQATVGRNLSLLGTNGAGLPVVISLVKLGNQTAVFNIQGDLILTGGQLANNPAQIGGMQSGSGNASFTVGGNVKLTGGSASNAYAQIGFSDDDLFSGNILFDEIGGDVILTSGTDADAYAQIGHANGNPGFSNFTAIGDVTLNEVLGEIKLQAGQSSAIIGHGNPSTGGEDFYKGSIIVDAIGPITLSASDSAPAAIGFSVGGAGTSTAESPLVSVSGESLTLNGGNQQDVYVGFYNSASTTIALSDIGLVQVEMRQDIHLNPGQTAGLGLSGAAVIGTGGTTDNTFADVFVKGDNIFLNGSSAANGATSFIQTSTVNAPVSRNVTILSENLFASSIGNGGEIHATGDILAVAESDIVLHSGTVITTPTGSIALVVDNKAPESPQIDDGRFILDPNVLIQTSGPVRIFTARRSQNSIQSLINGANFIPGPLFVDSDSEIWGTYFPNEKGGFPFTIFYKSGLSTDIYNELGRTFAEMFQNLQTYDELLFEPKCFLFGYDKACYDQLFYPRGMVSSFDLFGEECRETLRQKYRNYQTKYVESF